MVYRWSTAKTRQGSEYLSVFTMISRSSGWRQRREVNLARTQLEISAAGGQWAQVEFFFFSFSFSSLFFLLTILDSPLYPQVLLLCVVIITTSSVHPDIVL